MLGEVDWNFNKLIKFYRLLVQTGLTPKMFFDNNVYRTLKEDNLIKPGQTIEDCLSQLLDCDSSMLVVSKQGERADPLIIEYAAKNQCCVLSNDNYDKDEDSKISGAAKRIKDKEMIFKVKEVKDTLIVLGRPKIYVYMRYLWVGLMALYLYLALFSSIDFR